MTRSCRPGTLAGAGRARLLRVRSRPAELRELIAVRVDEARSSVAARDREFVGAGVDVSEPKVDDASQRFVGEVVDIPAREVAVDDEHGEFMGVDLGKLSRRGLGSTSGPLAEVGISDSERGDQRGPVKALPRRGPLVSTA